MLVLAATPIGSLEDAPARLATELGRADVVAAEDTRRLARLAAGLGVQVRGRTVSYFEGNEVQRTEELLAALRSGARVLLVTDAGTPSVSDPGYRIVVAAAAAGLRVTAVPGPSAVTTALAVSGLPVARWAFEGFLPRKPGERRALLDGLAEEQRTLVFFESPHRLAVSLADLAAAFGADRPGAVCRELTKTYEEVRRGGLGELAEWAERGVRGEVTVVVAGAVPRADDAGPDELARRVAEREVAGATRKEAIAQVAAEAGRRKRDVYEAVVAGRLGAAAPEAGRR